MQYFESVSAAQYQYNLIVSKIRKDMKEKKRMNKENGGDGGGEEGRKKRKIAERDSDDDLYDRTNDEMRDD